VTGNVKLSPQDFEEIVEIRWFPFDEAFTTISHETTKQTLLDLREYISKNTL